MSEKARREPGFLRDSSNLVTMAMKGWADSEPEWWLNLQAQPDRSGRLWLHRTGQVAQLVEHRSEKPGVGGSNPPLTTSQKPLLRHGFRHSRHLALPSASGPLPV
jgi:hypothetical protein